MANDADVEANWDSQCWFPPLELAALVAAGVLPAGVPVLDVGCGAGIEAIFLASRGWAVYGIDEDHTAIERARRLATRYRAKPTFHAGNIRWRPEDLPEQWPRSYGIVLDRFCMNNVVDEDFTREMYFKGIASFLSPGGLYVLRGRPDDIKETESTFVRRLFDSDGDQDVPEGAKKYFDLLQGGRALDARFVGDDTPDWNRTDAMIPIRGWLAVLKKRAHSPSRRRRRA